MLVFFAFLVILPLAFSGDNSIYFNGDHTTLITLSSAPAGVVSQQYSMALWFKRASTGTGQQSLVGYGKSQTPTRGIEMRLKNDRLEFNFNVYQSSTSYTLTNPSPTEASVWHFGAGVFNNNTGQRNLIYDGASVASDYGDFSYRTASHKTLTIGGDYYVTTFTREFANTFNGSIARVYFFNRALDAGELNSLFRYAAGVKITLIDITGLLLYSSLNGSYPATSIADESGNGATLYFPSAASLGGGYIDPTWTNTAPTFTTPSTPLYSGREGNFGGLVIRNDSTYAVSSRNVDLRNDDTTMVTVIVWLKVRSSYGTQTAWAQGNNSDGIYFALRNEGGNLTPVLGFTYPGPSWFETDSMGFRVPEVLPDYVWHMWSVRCFYEPITHTHIWVISVDGIQHAFNPGDNYYGTRNSPIYLGHDPTGHGSFFDGTIARFQVYKRTLSGSDTYSSSQYANELMDLYLGNPVSSYALTLDVPLAGSLFDFADRNNPNNFIGYGLSNAWEEMPTGPCDINPLINCRAGCSDMGLMQEDGTYPQHWQYDTPANFTLPYTFVLWYNKIDSSSFFTAFCETVGGELSGIGIKLTGLPGGQLAVKSYRSGSYALSTTPVSMINGWNHVMLVVPDGNHYSLYVNGALWMNNQVMNSPSSITLSSLQTGNKCSSSASGGALYDARFYSNAILTSGVSTQYPTSCAFGGQAFP